MKLEQEKEAVKRSIDAEYEESDEAYETDDLQEDTLAQSPEQEQTDGADNAAAQPNADE